MLVASKLPRFMDYLFLHYQRLYEHYYGRLTELFPCYDGLSENLSISADENSNETEDKELIELWKEFK
ncbi:MAG TPA: hypothetical protein VFR58_13090 [Flavisolibacter sp.]|nr:hypothetical protein [Flavisolibacter sp.]